MPSRDSLGIHKFPGVPAPAPAGPLPGTHQTHAGLTTLESCPSQSSMDYSGINPKRLLGRFPAHTEHMPRGWFDCPGIMSESRQPLAVPRGATQMQVLAALPGELREEAMP
jgi:hypothetical protein